MNRFKLSCMTRKKTEAPSKNKKPDKSVSPMYYIVMGSILVVLIKHFVLDGQTLFFNDIRNVLHSEPPAAQTQSVEVEPASVDPAEYPHTDKSKQKFSFFWQESKPVEVEQEVAEDVTEKPAPSKPEKQPDKKEYVKPNLSGSKYKIAIIIDDVGMSEKYSRAVIDDLPPQITLALLPYAPNIKATAKRASKAGHELMVHVPMQATRKMDLGPNGLTTNMDRDAVRKSLKQSFAAFDGYVGINNHMGSAMTQDSKRMGWIMDELKKRDLFFVDSKTIQTSIAAETASRYGIPYASRHVFLDHNEDRASVDASLRKLERYARRHGAGIAIGHPKKHTVEALKAWIKTLDKNKFELVPVSDLLLYPKDAQRVTQSEDEEEVVPLFYKPDFSFDMLMYKPNGEGSGVAPISLTPNSTNLDSMNPAQAQEHSAQPE
jgi:polysaccharide deacetylase 2 family uncharacterized protein YibQ